MMTLLKILAVIAICAFMVGVVKLLEDFDHKLSTFIEAHNGNVQAANNRFSGIDHRITEIEEYRDLDCTRINEADEQIDQILDRLNAITEDIARIDRDEKEIRSYYVNYREPAVSTGVAWSNEFVCGDDNNE